MLKPIFEGNINIFLKAPASGTLPAGTIVKQAPNGEFAIAVAGDQPYGVLGQNVVARNVDNFKLDSVTYVAYYGEKAGIYFGGGQYYTDNTATAVTEGAKLYVGAGGKFTTVVPSSGYTAPIAFAEGVADAGKKVRITLL